MLAQFVVKHDKGELADGQELAKTTFSPTLLLYSKDLPEQREESEAIMVTDSSILNS